WLWEVFESIYVPDDLRFKYGYGHSTGMQLQREIVQFYSKPIWFNWQYWKKHLLDYQVPVATELVFRRDYVPHEKPSREEPIMRSTYNFGFQPIFTSAATTTTGYPAYIYSN